MNKQVRQERTGWRDQALSQRHRSWGWDCPAIDIDFLMIEYDSGTPVALVEYKHKNASRQTSRHPSYQALIKLANRAELPLFCVRYTTDFSQWIVAPLNYIADDTCAEIQTMSEAEYIDFLYTLRGRRRT